jgi:hypothetical protein
MIFCFLWRLFLQEWAERWFRDGVQRWGSEMGFRDETATGEDTDRRCSHREDWGNG